MWLLSQDRKSPRLECWGMRALRRRAQAGLEEKAALPDLAWAGAMVGIGEKVRWWVVYALRQFRVLPLE